MSRTVARWLCSCVLLVVGVFYYFLAHYVEARRFREEFLIKEMLFSHFFIDVTRPGAALHVMSTHILAATLGRLGCICGLHSKTPEESY